MFLITSGKTNFKYILIIILAAFFAAGTIFFYSNQIKKEETEMVELSKSIEPDKEIKKEIKISDFKPLNTSGWQTYRNEKYGFEFLYPKEMAVKEDIKIENQSFFYIYDKTSCVGDCDNPFIKIRFGISDNSDFLPLSKFIEQELETDIPGTDEYFKVDGFDGIMRLWRGKDDQFLIAFAVFSGKRLDKVYYFLAAGQENIEILKEILRNFHFIVK